MTPQTHRVRFSPSKLALKCLKDCRSSAMKISLSAVIPTWTHHSQHFVVPRCAKMCQGSQASLSLRPVEVIYDLGSPWVLLLLKSACCISSSDCVGQENKSQNCIVTCGNHTSYKLQTHNCVMLYYQHLSTIQVIRLYLDAEFTYLLQNEIQ